MTELNPYDLTPPNRRLVPPYRPLVPQPASQQSMQRYVPVLQPPGTARVILDNDYYAGDIWHDYEPSRQPYPGQVYDVPQEQRDRWQAACDAYSAMQDEIRELTDQRWKAQIAEPE